MGQTLFLTLKYLSVGVSKDGDDSNVLFFLTPSQSRIWKKELAFALCLKLLSTNLPQDPRSHKNKAKIYVHHNLIYCYPLLHIQSWQYLNFINRYKLFSNASYALLGRKINVVLKNVFFYKLEVLKVYIKEFNKSSLSW